MMTQEGVPPPRIEPRVPPPSRTIDLVIVTAPKPPGSMQSISPLSAVLEIAPANVLQGAVRLHGLTSSPTPETHVLVACACATIVRAIVKTNRVRRLMVNRTVFISLLLLGG